MSLSLLFFQVDLRWVFFFAFFVQASCNYFRCTMCSHYQVWVCIWSLYRSIHNETVSQVPQQVPSSTTSPEQSPQVAYSLSTGVDAAFSSTFFRVALFMCCIDNYEKMFVWQTDFPFTWFNFYSTYFLFLLLLLCFHFEHRASQALLCRALQRHVLPSWKLLT